MYKTFKSVHNNLETKLAQNDQMCNQSAHKKIQMIHLLQNDNKTMSYIKQCFYKSMYTCNDSDKIRNR